MKPELHFISTGSTFPYPYYLAIMSALKTQNVSAVNLWMTFPISNTRYFNLIKDRVHVINIEAPTFRALEAEAWRPHVLNAHIKDYLQWQILYERGGLYMDLDVICIKDVTDLLSDDKVSTFWDDPTHVRMNISVMAAPPKSDFILGLLRDAEDKLNKQDSIEWNEIGGKLLMDHITETPDDVMINEYGLAGHIIGAGIAGMFYDANIKDIYNPDVRIAHLFASACEDFFVAVDETYIEARNSIYARLVRQVLTKEEREAAPWDLVKDIGGKDKFVFERNVNGYPMFLLREEPYLSVACRHEHVWEPETTGYVKNNLKEGETFIDIGAGIGYYTVLASKLVGDTGRVIAFEPCQANIGLLNANLILNGCKNTRVIEKAAAADKGTARLYMWGGSKDLLQRSLIHETAAFEDVETTLIDEEVALNAPSYMIKVDVDGGEAPVIDGMVKLLHTSVPIDIVIEDYTYETVKRLCSTYGALVVGAEKPASNYWLQIRNGTRSITTKEWQRHNGWESSWWGECVNTFDEQVKQQAVAEYMKITQFIKYNSNFEYGGAKQMKCNSYFDLAGRSVLDIGGGPVSLLLRCTNYSRAVVVDPCDYPKWVEDRYKAAGIKLIRERAEDVELGGKFDEAWLYNVLQHVQDPIKIIELAKRKAKKIRVCELLNIGECMGHPHNLTKEMLDKAFGRQGLTEGPYFFGVFSYE